MKIIFNSLVAIWIIWLATCIYMLVYLIYDMGQCNEHRRISNCFHQRWRECINGDNDGHEAFLKLSNDLNEYFNKKVPHEKLIEWIRSKVR